MNIPNLDTDLFISAMCTKDTKNITRIADYIAVYLHGAYSSEYFSERRKVLKHLKQTKDILYDKDGLIPDDKRFNIVRHEVKIYCSEEEQKYDNK